MKNFNNICFLTSGSIYFEIMAVDFTSAKANILKGTDKFINSLSRRKSLLESFEYIKEKITSTNIFS